MSKITLFDDKNSSEELDSNSDEYKQRVAEGWTTWKKPTAKKPTAKKPTAKKPKKRYD
jgi:hypothetical protein|tara:strand:- start:7180 stop:7353 length:174 start_codon:yes stop_codon:yes gene_type:complete